MKAMLLKLGFFVLTIISANNLMAFTAVTDGDWTNPLTWGGVALPEMSATRTLSSHRVLM